MAPRKKNEREIESQNNVLHMLNAIRPNIGKLKSVAVQQTLTQKVLKDQGLGMTDKDLRSRLFGAISRNRAKPGVTKGEEIFTKPAEEVIDRKYLDTIGYNITKRKSTMQSEKKKPTLKINPAAALKKVPQTEQTSSPLDRESSPAMQHDRALPATGTDEADEADEQQLPATSSAGEIVKETLATTARRISPPHRRSPSPARDFQHFESHADRLEDSAIGATETPGTTDLVDSSLQEESADAQRPIDSLGEEAESINTDHNLATDDGSLVQSSQDEQPVDDPVSQLEHLKVAQAAIIDLQAQLEQSRQREETAKERIEDLEAQAHSFTNKKRPSSSPEHPAKRQKSEMVILQEESRHNISKDMIALSNDLHNLVADYFHVRDLDMSAWTKFVLQPSPQLECLYARIFHSEKNRKWKAVEASNQYRGYRTMMRLIAADILHSVFLERPRWDRKDMTVQSLAGVGQYLEMDSVDKIIRDAAFERINERSFQDGEVADYAEELMRNLGFVIAPHLDIMINGRPRSSSTQWLVKLKELYRRSLIIKTMIDTYDGKVEAFWPSIGDQMDPVTTDPPGFMHKDLPQEICGVEWAGLKLKVEGEEDIILARAQVEAMVIENE